MYQQFYGFKKKPFQLVPNPDFLFRSKKHDVALTYLEYGVYDRVGFILITGEVGTGKTTLLKYLLRTIKQDLPIVYLSQTFLNPYEFLSILCQKLALPFEGKGKAELIEIFRKFLIEQSQIGRHFILILDEAQNLPLETLEEIRMLSNMDGGNENLLQIILVGQAELRNKLRREGLRQFAQRIEVSYHLGPLDHDETREYIRYRINTAEGPDQDLFSDAAIDEIYNYSKGIPRIINAICHMCLVYGMADELRKIGLPQISNVLKERPNWDIIPVDEDSTDLETGGVVSAPAVSVKLEHILKNLDSKLGRFVDIAATSQGKLEELTAGIAKQVDLRESANPTNEPVMANNQWGTLISLLSQMQENIAHGVKNYDKIIAYLYSQKEEPRESKPPEPRIQENRNPPNKISAPKPQQRAATGYEFAVSEEKPKANWNYIAVVAGVVFVVVIAAVIYRFLS